VNANRTLIFLYRLAANTIPRAPGVQAHNTNLRSTAGRGKTLKEDLMTKKMKTLITPFAVAALMLAITPTSPAFERHPEIQSALESLHHAKVYLERAAHDYHGHRVDAIRAIDEADRQLRICMEVD
jgi:hypothetical protein